MPLAVLAARLKIPKTLGVGRQARLVGPIEILSATGIPDRNRVRRVRSGTQGFHLQNAALRSSLRFFIGESVTGPPAIGSQVRNDSSRSRCSTLVTRTISPGWSRSLSSVGGRMAIESSNPWDGPGRIAS